MERVNKVKLILWTILGGSLAVAITRFIFGLGVTTNLSDNSPWGFWIGFDVMGGVALASGGFVIAAFYYIFGKKALYSIVRAAILTAFLGYVSVVIGLLFDLGLPWNIWHMIIYWNPHSPLFEVGWCVMLYLSVLTLEFAPVVLEKYNRIKLLASVHRFLDKIKIPLVILGIMLSTLHQSSLGSLFLAMPYRLHPLWYSPIIPIIFFVSAICLGLMMVMVGSLTSSYLYKKEYEKDILIQISKYSAWILSFYAILRFSDIIIRGAGVFLSTWSWGTFLFWLETLLSIIIPLFTFSIPYSRNKISILYFGALTGVIGIVFNRLNVGGLTHLNNLTEIGTFYFPSWMELVISAGVVSTSILVFFYFIENYKVWDKNPIDLYSIPRTKPLLTSLSACLEAEPNVIRAKLSFAFVIAFGFAFAFISEESIYNEGCEKSPVVRARGGDTLLIDGNRNNYGVSFAHKKHQSVVASCGYCHHLNKPGDKATGCYECHNDMYRQSDAFQHSWHSSSQGANLGCFKCHSWYENKGKNFVFTSDKLTQLCLKCHKDIIPADSRIEYLKTYKTLSYTDAMHNLCIKCHERMFSQDALLRKQNPNLTRCSNCHNEFEHSLKEKKIFVKKEKNQWVVIPSVLQNR